MTLRLSAATLLIAAMTVAPARAAAVGAAAPSKDKDDVFAKCGVRTPQGFVIPIEKISALADNLTDPEFAKYDERCLGKRNNPDAVVEANRTKERQSRRKAQDIRDEAVAQSKVPGRVEPIPVETARSAFGPAAELQLPVLFRDAYSAYSLLSAPPPKERATGTQVSYTHDYLNQNDIVSAKGAIIAWKVFDVPPNNPLSGWGVTRTLFAPGVEFDQTRNHVDPKKNTDYLAFKLTTEIEKEAPGTIAPLQFFRLAGYWKTDSKGESSIFGGAAEWQPYNLDYAIGVAPRLFGTPLQFRWTPILHAEVEKVLDAGPLTSVRTGDVYARLGPVLSADIFFAEGILQQLVLNFQYRYLWNFAHLNAGKDVHYLQVSAAYNVDPGGNIALSATYRDGITPGNGTPVRDIKTGLTVKY
jgi:hypothetical protein